MFPDVALKSAAAKDEAPLVEPSAAASLIANVRLEERSPPPVNGEIVEILRVVGTLASRAVCWAVETGLFASLVLSAFPRPTWLFVTACGFEVFPVWEASAAAAAFATTVSAAACAVET